VFFPFSPPLFSCSKDILGVLLGVYFSFACCRVGANEPKEPAKTRDLEEAGIGEYLKLLDLRGFACRARSLLSGLCILSLGFVFAGESRGDDRVLFSIAEQSEGHAKFGVAEPGGEFKEWLLKESPPLTAEWSTLNFRFVSAGTGTVRIYLSPAKSSDDLPTLFSDVKVNGTAMPMVSGKEGTREEVPVGWFLKVLQGGTGRLGNLADGPDIGEAAGAKYLIVYCQQGAYVFFPVKQGESVDISVRAKLGSPAAVCAAQLGDMAQKLGRCLPMLRDSSGKREAVAFSERQLTGNLNGLIRLSETALGVVLPPLPEGSRAEVILAKIESLRNAYLDLIRRDSSAPRPPLSDKPDMRKNFLDLLRQSDRAISDLEVSAYLEFMLSARSSRPAAMLAFSDKLSF